MNQHRQCAACGQLFEPRPQTYEQKFCSARQCQRVRKSRWQKQKMHADSDYRDNQTKAQTRWLERNPDYWRTYREEHANYTERNRQLQRTRNKQKAAIAKMDSSAPIGPLHSGVYTLRPMKSSLVARMVVWRVHLTVLSVSQGA